MAREGFLVYHEMLEWLEPYSADERGRLLTAMLKYSMSGEAPTLTGNERFIWPAIKAKIDNDKSRYEKRCETNRINRQQSSTIVNDRQRNAPTETTTETETKTETKPKQKQKSERVFTPPTLEEVKSYCQERKSSVDPLRFWTYYNAGNWKDAKGQPVRNWKQKLITWEGKDGGTISVRATPPSEPMSLEDQARKYGNPAEKLAKLQQMIGGGP